MVSTTFLNLPADKQDRIRAALLTEFSAHPLVDAQVARIVREAAIARGAFYKYFADLPDAYRYLFGQVMHAVHGQVPKAGTGSVAQYVQATSDLLLAVRDSAYRDFLAVHFRFNEWAVAGQPSPVAGKPELWAAEVLCHQTLRDVILAPDTAEERLVQLRVALNIVE
ncbi:TetR/AcrR family transcriptional regulator [Lacticaseibacillus hulanensis]|uniref:TetR/AcrR family transcriptional regulator n=1 Tax=Lacticaseibacillus hulanensis TaxID=2493111 RepID=UPI000FDAB5D5|nr:TetR/AcrR family transcriptional regulator [Lacticaseibacillus hulanensis]